MSFVDDFVAYAESPCRTSPPQFLWWTALGLISNVVGQGFWTFLRGGSDVEDRLYPNLFVLLLGISGSGTSSPVDEARRLLNLAGIPMAPDALRPTSAVPGAPTFPAFGSMPRSLSVLLDERTSRSTKAFLCNGYDAAMVYPQNGQPPYQISVSILSACTPAHLNQCFRRADWHEELPGRFIYCWGERLPRAREAKPRDTALEAKLIESLQAIEAAAQSGMEIKWSEEALEARQAWAAEPTHSPHMNLMGYWARREITLSKVSCCLAIARSSLVVSLEDWIQARQALEACEANIHIALGAASTNPYHSAIQWLKGWFRDNPDVSEAQARHQMSWHFHPRDVETILEDLERQGWIIREVQADGLTIRIRHPAQSRSTSGSRPTSEGMFGVPLAPLSPSSDNPYRTRPQ